MLSVLKCFIYLVNEPASPLYSVCCILLQIYLNIRLVSVIVCDNANSKFDFERLSSYSRITFVPFVLLLTNLNHSSLKNAILKTKIDDRKKFTKSVISVSVFNDAEGNGAYDMPCACVR